jgi:20S proteasome subunit alpha 6
MGGGRGRGGGMGMNRGGNRGGRGGGMYNNMGGRGGGPGQGGGSFRGHGQNRGFGNRDNRRGGSFNAGPGSNFSHGNLPQQPASQQPSHHPQHGFSGSFRGRNQGYVSSHARGGRHDSAGLHKESSTSSAISSGKKDENRRTLTDFKIVGLEIQDLAWSWGTVPNSSSVADVKEELDESQVPPSLEGAESHSAEQKSVVDSNSGTEGRATAADALAAPSEQATTSDAPLVKTEAGSVLLPPPPSRIRIYFHTPVTADDAHALSQSSFSHGPSSESSVRKGKRKKLEDDDGDIEDGRGPPPPPPQHSGIDHEESNASTGPDFEGTDSAVGRSSIAPSVAETASEGDWLMAAIGEEETEEGDGEHHQHVPDTDDLDAEGEPDDYDGKH